MYKRNVTFGNSQCGVCRHLAVRTGALFIGMSKRTLDGTNRRAGDELLQPYDVSGGGQTAAVGSRVGLAQAAIRQQGDLFC